MKSSMIAVNAIILMFLMGFAMAPVCAGQAEAPTAGWINIMPDSSLDHWTRVALPPSHALSKQSQWSVEAATHTLVCAGNGGHEWLRYGRKFGNVLFHVEWRIVRQEGAPSYNSGVFVRNSRNGVIWYQAQIGNASGGYWFGKDQPGGGPIGFSLQSAMTSRPVKPAGQWNNFDIRCVGSKLILTVNGIETSKFEHCRNSHGYLGLEAEGSRVEFRRLRVKVLP